MAESIPDAVTRRFRSAKARPIVVRVYRASTGWEQASLRRALTADVIDDLLREGVTMVEARWRFTSHEFSLTRLRNAPS